MMVTAKSFRLMTAALPVVLAGSLLSAPVLASRVTNLVKQNVKAKILSEAKDRSHVSFATTHEVRLTSRLHRVTGRGIFERGRKSPQRFQYHGTVDIRSGVLSDLGYNVKR